MNYIYEKVFLIHNHEPDSTINRLTVSNNAKRKMSESSIGERNVT